MSFSAEHNRRVARHCHDQGIELTPDQVVAERRAAYRTIREKMRQRGLKVPDSDEELAHLLAEVCQPPAPIRPATPEEIAAFEAELEAELDAMEPVPLSEERMQEILDFAINSPELTEAEEAALESLGQLYFCELCRQPFFGDHCRGCGRKVPR
ncbi:MAG: hypothetical protein JO270_04830 [Acidobacteriaceae bacterium]|nr:hypothetical protein [Acidobacteriaceae bacterium]